jgi:anti-sigma-K factor RskA
MAKKDAARHTHMTEGKKLLEQWGINLARLQDQSITVATVQEQIGKNPAADVALAALLGNYPTPEVEQALAVWEAKATDKELRHEIRRSLYKLSQKGIATKRAEQAPPPSIFAPIEPEAYLSPIDGRGDRLLWLVKAKAGGGLHYLSAVVNEPEGLRYFDAAEINRKKMRQMRQDFSARMQMAMVEAPWRYCDFVMYEGYERAKARGEKEVDAYPALRTHLLSAPAQPSAVPLPAGLDAAVIAADESLLQTSAQLLQERELQLWLLDHERAHHYTDQISQVQESPLILNRLQQQDRFQTVIDSAVNEVFAGEQGAAYARRLEETAFYLAATDRLDAAKRALAASLALRRSTQGGKGIPFCEELVRQSIAMHYHEEKQHEQEESRGSLIMKPAEFAARMQAAQAQRRGVR